MCTTRQWCASETCRSHARYGIVGPMKIAVPTEVKNNEFRVAITPVGVHELVRRGHEVFVQQGAGLGSSIND